MKILLWPSYYFPCIGGLELMTRALAKELHRRGHAVAVFADHKNVSQYRENKIDGIPVHYFPFQAALESKKPSLLKETIEQTSQILHAFAPDVVNIHGWYEFFSFFQIRVLKNIPFFLTIHGLLGQIYRKSNSCIELWSQAKGINTVSYALIDQLAQDLWTHPSLRVIYNGLFFAKDPAPTAEPEGQKICMIGRFSKEKCFETGLYAFKKLKETLPNATLCIAGGGDDWDILQQLRKNLQLEADVQMLGFIPPDAIPRFIDQANIVWIPSHYESFSLVALEAASRKRVVVASDVFGLKEVVEDGRTGRLIPARNPDLLAQETLHLLQKPLLRRQMGEAAYRRAATLFSIETCADHYVQMYQKICKSL